MTPSIDSTVAIVGSRSFPFGLWPTKCVQQVDEAISESGFAVDKVVSGGADGVDSASAAWAEDGGVPCIEIEPDWETHGKQAGPRRNSSIVRRADAVVALWNGSSTGTRDTIAKARHALGDERVHIFGIGGASPSVEDVPPKEL